MINPNLMMAEGSHLNQSIDQIGSSNKPEVSAQVSNRLKKVALALGFTAVATLGINSEAAELPEQPTPVTEPIDKYAGGLLTEADLMPQRAHEMPRISAEAITPPEVQNIIFIFTDDQTYESIEHMPFVNKTEWNEFANAHVNVALCCPSRATVLTGLYSHNVGVENNLEAKNMIGQKTIADWLKHRGSYRTAMVGKYFNQYPFGKGAYKPRGWDYWFALSGNGQYNDPLIYKDDKPGKKYEGYSTKILGQAATGFIERADEPFFLYFAPNAPHGPRTPEPKFKHAFKDLEVKDAPNFAENDLSDKPDWLNRRAQRKGKITNRIKEARKDQYRTLLSVDKAVKSIFRTLEERKLLDKTAIIYMSDNGYAFGEHSYIAKSCEYDVCSHVPLLIHYPPAEASEIDGLVSNVDIAPTILDIAGVEPSYPQDGQSLLPLLENQTEKLNDSVLIHWGGGNHQGKKGGIPAYWGIRTEKYKYVELETGEVELYNLKNDPHELNNVAGNQAYIYVKSKLAAKLAELLES